MSRQPLVFKLASGTPARPDVGSDEVPPADQAPGVAAGDTSDTASTTGATELFAPGDGDPGEPPAAVEALTLDRPTIAAPQQAVEPASVELADLPPSLRARASAGLDAFSSEHEIRFRTHPPAAPRGGSPLLVGAAAVAALGLAGVLYVTVFRTTAPPLAAASAVTGLAQFDSRPGGAEVIIDGTVRGTTPLKLSLPVGAHTLEIRGETGSRTLPLAIEAGVLVSQYVELMATPSATAGAQTGRLDITSDPPGAQVRLDGVVRGLTPLTIDAVDASEHRVSLTRDGATIYRTVRVAPGATASVMASLSVPVATSGAVGGFLSLAVPFEVQVLENGRLLGSSRSDRLMMPTGRHELELVNTALQFHSPLAVSIQAGKVASPAVTIPDGTLSINAIPWAEVFLDGQNVGTTPLANLAVPIGTHDVVWRHPQLGERRQAVVVTVQAPARAGVNFSQ